MTSIAIDREWSDSRKMIRAGEDVQQACREAREECKHLVAALPEAGQD